MILVPLTARLRELVSALCDGVINDSDFAELQTSLTDPDTLRSYVRYIQMHGSLLASAPQANDDVYQLLKQFQPTIDMGPAKPRTPILGLLGGMTQSMTRSPLVTTLLVAALVYGTFGLLAWNLRPEKLPGGADGDGRTVATISDAIDVTWSDGSTTRSKNSTVKPGELLKLDEGVVELELNHGAKLLIEGPAEFEVRGARQFQLQLGKLLANVPQLAVGFTVETPTATIVDLGTEFIVEVNQAKQTKVAVTKGAVELVSESDGKSGSASRGQRTRLLAGQAMTVTREKSGVVSSQHEPFDATWTVQATSKKPSTTPIASKPQEIVVKQTFASSTYPSDRLHSENLIRGRGLGPSGRHTAQDQANAYWHTEIGHVQGEFVVFELPKQYTLSFMSVWNYNQPDWCWRGIKEADIYVSDSGIGDPLKQPDAWRLVLSKQPFTIAPGSGEYDHPDVISLNRCKARFVAIVIDKIHGDGVSAEAACAGLSEVKFFGFPIP